MAVEFRLSQFGKHTDFSELKDAVRFVKKNKLTEDNYLIWIEGSSRREMDSWRNENEKVFNESQNDSNSLDTQLAMLDPKFDEGSVLGTSSGTGESIFTKAEDLLSPALLSAIPVNTTADSDQLTLEEYAFLLLKVETQYDSFGLMASLNSDDKTLLAGTAKTANEIVGNLKAMVVPKEFEEFHKIKLMYYGSIQKLGEIFTEQDTRTDLGSTTEIFFSVSEKLERMRNEIQTKHNILL